MTWPNDLAPIEIAALEALAEACNYSLSAHQPEGWPILRRTKIHLRGDLKKGLKRIVRRGLCRQQPTGGNMTYSLTRDGLDLAFRIFGR